MINEWPEAYGFHRLRRCRLRTLEDVSDAKRQLARLKGFRQIIVGADLEALDASFSSIAGGQHQDWHIGIAADRLGQIEAGFSRHHHVENEQIETQAFQS